MSLDRRRALQIVAALLAASAPDRARGQTSGTRQKILLNPKGSDVLELDFGSGASTVKFIVLTQGTISRTISVSDLFAALA